MLMMSLNSLQLQVNTVYALRMFATHLTTVSLSFTILANDRCGVQFCFSLLLTIYLGECLNLAVATRDIGPHVQEKDHVGP